jgi:5-methyltetrahydropteroyltriglutamate--homocysteine methyltransferase
MKITVLGSYPRIPAGAGPSVRTAWNRFDRGQITPAELEATVRAVTRSVLDLAGAVALDTTTDGQVRWHDLTDPVSRDIENLVAGGLQRFFNNNFYYRKPAIRGRLSWTGGALAEWTRIARELRPDVPLKVTLPGPITLADLSEDQSYGDRSRLLADLVAVLRLEAESVIRAGAAEVQWDEPSVVAGPAVPAAEVLQVWRDLVPAHRAVPESLALYFGSASPWWNTLAAAPFDRVYLDLVADSGLLGQLSAEEVPFEPGLGLLDAREVRLEQVAEVAPQIEAVLRRQGAERVWVHPSAGLEGLPPDWAQRKVERLGEIRDAVTGTRKEEHHA